MTWGSKTKPTPANIRRRITAAEDAALAAITLIKLNKKLDVRGGPALPLSNAIAWLADAQRKTKR